MARLNMQDVGTLESHLYQLLENWEGSLSLLETVSPHVRSVDAKKGVTELTAAIEVLKKFITHGDSSFSWGIARATVNALPKEAAKIPDLPREAANRENRQREREHNESHGV